MICSWQWFLDMKSTGNKVTIDEWEYIKIKGSAQQTSQQNEKPVYGICRNYILWTLSISDEWIMSTVYKEFL